MVWNIRHASDKHPRIFEPCMVVSPYDGSHVRVGGHDFFEVTFVAEYNDLIEPARAKTI